MRAIISTVFLSFACTICMAQNVGINNDGSVPAASAMLDVKSSSKGVLIPRVTLTGTNDMTTIASPINSLLIYNTAAAGSGATRVEPGYYYWGGSAWAKLLSTTTTMPSTVWKTSGNTGTSTATDFIGTTDNQSLVFKVNNVKAGHIDLAGVNTFFGYAAGLSNTSGLGNTAIGAQALAANITGIDNIAVGEGTLQFAEGSNNNVAIGKFSLSNITTGYSNVVVGKQGMFKTGEGYKNIGVGYQTLFENTSGHNNVAAGEQSLFNNVSGNFNTTVGNRAMSSNVTGSMNTTIGYESNVSPGDLINATAIGARAVVGCDNCLVLGSAAGVNGATSDVNVGIGVYAPVLPLSFRSANGGKISLYQSGNAHYGLGIQTGLLQLYTPVESGDLGFGWGSSESFNEAVRIKGNKRLGIGTSDPTASLDIRRTANTTMNIYGSEIISHFHFGTEENTYIRGGKANANVIINDISGGRVGVGTDNPGATLDVKRTTTTTMNIQGSEFTSHFCFGPGEYTYIRGGKSGAHVIINDIVGNVGIGNPNPAHKLDVNGNINCNQVFEYSDVRLKMNIRPLTGVSELIQQLNGYRYQFKEDVRKETGNHIGVLAQEVQQVFPELVSTDNEGTLSVSYTGLVPVLLQAIKEQQQEINKLKERLNTLSIQISAPKQ